MATGDNLVYERPGFRIPNVFMTGGPGEIPACAPRHELSLRAVRGLLAELRPLFVGGRAYRLRCDDLSHEFECVVNLAVEEANEVNAPPAGPDLAERLLAGEPLTVRFDCTN